MCNEQVFYNGSIVNLLSKHDCKLSFYWFKSFWKYFLKNLEVKQIIEIYFGKYFYIIVFCILLRHENLIGDIKLNCMFMRFYWTEENLYKTKH